MIIALLTLTGVMLYWGVVVCVKGFGPSALPRGITRAQKITGLVLILASVFIFWAAVHA